MASPGAFGENCCVLESGSQCLEWERGMVREGMDLAKVRWEKLG